MAEDAVGMGGARLINPHADPSALARLTGRYALGPILYLLPNFTHQA